MVNPAWTLGENGMIVMAFVFFKVRAGTVTAARYGTLEYTGLYWHLVDVIWIFLFPLLYLIG